SPPTAASSPPTDHGPDLGWITTSHIDGRAGWWKSPCPDLARGRGGKPPGLLYNGLCTPPRRPRPPQHAPPLAPPPPTGAGRRGLQPGSTRGRTVCTGPAAGGSSAKLPTSKFS